jgi:hypothetical protein
MSNLHDLTHHDGVFSNILQYTPSGLIQLWLTGDKRIQHAIKRDTREWHMDDKRMFANGYLPRLVLEELTNLKHLKICVNRINLYAFCKYGNLSVLQAITKTIAPQLESLDLDLFMTSNYNYSTIYKTANTIIPSRGQINKRQWWMQQSKKQMAKLALKVWPTPCITYDTLIALFKACQSAQTIKLYFSNSIIVKQIDWTQLFTVLPRNLQVFKLNYDCIDERVMQPIPEEAFQQLPPSLTQLDVNDIADTFLVYGRINLRAFPDTLTSLGSMQRLITNRYLKHIAATIATTSLPLLVPPIITFSKKCGLHLETFMLPTLNAVTCHLPNLSKVKLMVKDNELKPKFFSWLPQSVQYVKIDNDIYSAINQNGSNVKYDTISRVMEESVEDWAQHEWPHQLEKLHFDVLMGVRHLTQILPSRYCQHLHTLEYHIYENDDDKQIDYLQLADYLASLPKLHTLSIRLEHNRSAYLQASILDTIPGLGFGDSLHYLHTLSLDITLNHSGSLLTNPNYTTTIFEALKATLTNFTISLSYDVGLVNEDNQFAWLEQIGILQHLQHYSFNYHNSSTIYDDNGREIVKMPQLDVSTLPPSLITLDIHFVSFVHVEWKHAQQPWSCASTLEKLTYRIWERQSNNELLSTDLTFLIAHLPRSLRVLRTNGCSADVSVAHLLPPKLEDLDLSFVDKHKRNSSKMSTYIDKLPSSLKRLIYFNPKTLMTSKFPMLEELPMLGGAYKKPYLEDLLADWRFYNHDRSFNVLLYSTCKRRVRRLLRFITTSTWLRFTLLFPLFFAVFFIANGIYGLYHTLFTADYHIVITFMIVLITITAVVYNVWSCLKLR